jgi:hypothetical protein
MPAPTLPRPTPTAATTTTTTTTTTAVAATHLVRSRTCVEFVVHLASAWRVDGPVSSSLFTKAFLDGALPSASMHVRSIGG